MTVLRRLCSLLLLAAMLPAVARAQHPVSGASVYALTKELLAVAPKRFNGAPGHLAAENFLKAKFAPEIKDHRFEEDTFTASTPAGLQTMHNFIVKYPGKKDGVIVLASHYETNYPLKDIAFYGANDGAATSALLIGIGQYLRTHPPQGYSVWLLLDDGEEAVKSWTAQDSLYGTRHLAAKWSQDGTLSKIKAVLVADMIGDHDLDILHDSSSSPALYALLRTAAKNTGHTAALSADETGVLDDTVPFAQRGVPVLDVIDLNYGPHDSAHPDGWHHTVGDTIDHVSAKSLETSADLLLELIKLIGEH